MLIYKLYGKSQNPTTHIFDDLMQLLIHSFFRRRSTRDVPSALRTGLIYCKCIFTVFSFSCHTSRCVLLCLCVFDPVPDVAPDFADRLEG